MPLPTLLIDACVPASLLRTITDVPATTAKSARLDNLSDSQLLEAIKGRYDILVTLERVLPDHGSDEDRPFAVVLLRVRDFVPATFASLGGKLRQAIQHVMPGDIVVLSA